MSTLGTTNQSKKNRKFLDYESYSSNAANESKYFLLPFKFHRLKSGNEVLVNEVGDFLIAENGSANRIIRREIDKIKEFLSNKYTNHGIEFKRVKENKRGKGNGINNAKHCSWISCEAEGYNKEVVLSAYSYNFVNIIQNCIRENGKINFVEKTIN